jgi:thiol-disulfide isomerase/thioredoxin
MESCPYCKVALRLMNELYKDNDEYKKLEIEIIDEVLHPEIAEQYDYFYVPTYYVADKKLHEGIVDKEKIKHVFDTAMLG